MGAHEVNTPKGLQQPEWPHHPAPDDVVIHSTEWSELRKGLDVLDANRRGGLFFELVPGHHVIKVHECIELQRSKHGNTIAEYRIVAQRGCTVTLDGGNKCRIVMLQRDSKLDAFGIKFVGAKIADGEGGGAICSKPGSEVRVVECTFSHCVVDGHKALEGGGAIKNYGGMLEVWKSSFHHNVAATGGALACTSGNLRVINCTFTGNLSTGAPDGSGFREHLCNGGAIRIDRLREGRDKARSFLLHNSHFECNNAKAFANGIVIEVWNRLEHTPPDGKLAVIQKCTFAHNGKQTPAGSAIIVHGTGDVLVADNTFKGNKARDGIFRAVLDKPYKVIRVQGADFDGNDPESPCFNLKGVECKHDKVHVDGKSQLGNLHAATA